MVYGPARIELDGWVGLRLSRRRRGEPDTGWQDVTATLSGTWTPDAGTPAPGSS